MERKHRKPLPQNLPPHLQLYANRYLKKIPINDEDIYVEYNSCEPHSKKEKVEKVQSIGGMKKGFLNSGKPISLINSKPIQKPIEKPVAINIPTKVNNNCDILLQETPTEEEMKMYWEEFKHHCQNDARVSTEAATVINRMENPYSDGFIILQTVIKVLCILDDNIKRHGLEKVEQEVLNVLLCGIPTPVCTIKDSCLTIIDPENPEILPDLSPLETIGLLSYYLLNEILDKDRDRSDKQYRTFFYPLLHLIHNNSQAFFIPTIQMMLYINVSMERGEWSFQLPSIYDGPSYKEFKLIEDVDGLASQFSFYYVSGKQIKFVRDFPTLVFKKEVEKTTATVIDEKCREKANVSSKVKVANKESLNGANTTSLSPVDSPNFARAVTESEKKDEMQDDPTLEYDAHARCSAKECSSIRYPVKVSPVKVSPVKLSPVKVSPVKVSPVKVSPSKDSPLKNSPVKECIATKLPDKKCPPASLGRRSYIDEAGADPSVVELVESVETEIGRDVLDDNAVKESDAELAAINMAEAVSDKESIKLKAVDCSTIKELSVQEVPIAIEKQAEAVIKSKPNKCSVS